MSRQKIVLTEAVPVTIETDNWPVVARGSDYEGGQCEAQANRTWEIVVRKHEDGRHLVHGSYATRFMGEHNLSGGELVAADADFDVPEAIRRVAISLGAPDRVYQQCLAEMPAQELT